MAERQNEAIATRAGAIRHRITASDPSPFVRRVVQAANADCDAYEFNVWHANADNVKSNGGDRAWGTQGSDAPPV